MHPLTHSIFKTQTKVISKTQFVFFLLTSLLLALCVLMPANAMAEKMVEKNELGKFKILPKSSDGAFTLDIQHNGKSIAQLNEPVKMISYDEVQKDVPLPGCETLKVNLKLS